MFPQFKYTWRSAILLALLVMVLLLFLVEVSIFGPGFLSRPINDYDHYVDTGRLARSLPNKCSVQLETYYPMPATLWVFIPLSLLPNWFVFIWMIVPFFFLLWLFKKSGVILWLYYPMVVQAGFGQIDGWLLLPFYWLFENRPWLAGVSAVLVLFKPQLGFFAVLYAFGSWIIKRDWRNLGTFGVTLTLLYLPTFFVCPTWPFIMLGLLNKRSSESNMPTRGASLWAWIWHGDWTLWLLPIVAIVAAALVIYVFVVRGKRVQSVQLFGLLVTPVLYASNFVTIIPMLKTSRQIVILTIMSWVGIVIDTLAGGWGGAYAIIPIAALILLARNSTPSTP